jgi:septal ring factor EnvC (AmiA/AmiB activator)
LSEVTDLVLPLLQRMQSDLSELKRDMAAVKATLAQHSEKFEELEIYTAYETSLGTQNKADLQAIKKTIKAMEQRLHALETSR